MRGFTLLEVLVSVAILAIIMVCLYGAYTSNVATIKSARYAGEVSQTARIILDFMCRDLEGATVGSNSGFIGEKIEIGGREADQLMFATLSDMPSIERGASGDLKKVHYYLSENSDGEDLILYRAAEGLAGANVLYGKETYELSHSVVSLKITYEDSKGALHEDWSDMADGREIGMPSLVRIMLILRELGGRVRVFTTSVHPQLGKTVEN